MLAVPRGRGIVARASGASSCCNYTRERTCFLLLRRSSAVKQVFNSEKELTEDVVAIDGIVYSLEVRPSMCACDAGGRCCALSPLLRACAHGWSLTRRNLVCRDGIILGATSSNCSAVTTSPYRCRKYPKP